MEAAVIKAGGVVAVYKVWNSGSWSKAKAETRAGRGRSQGINWKDLAFARPGGVGTPVDHAPEVPWSAGLVPVLRRTRA